MTALRQFLSRREAEIVEQIKLLEAELAEIRTAWSALQRDESAESSERVSTIKDMVRGILRSRPDGLSAGEILAEIKERFAVHVERTSLSPQLSRLRSSEEVTLQGGRWYSTQIPLSHMVMPHHGRATGSQRGGDSDLL
ncbi:MAG TPA: hypothetical protein VF662_01835 [Allosphingosinicella sp.]|jgi:hypothetical protein